MRPAYAGRIPFQTQSFIQPSLVSPMLTYAILFLVIAIVAGILGFWGIAGTSAMIAKVLFVIFLVLFLAAFIRGRRV